MAKNDDAGDSTARPGSRLQAIWNRFGHVIRAWLIFVASIAVSFQILIWVRPFTDNVLTRWVAAVSAWIMSVMGYEGEAQGTVITSSIGSLAIIRECTGVYPSAMYVSAVLAFPCDWRRKLLGALGGMVAIQILNQVRIISLFFIQKYYASSFTFAHLTVWQSLMVFLTGLIWLVWATELTGRPKHHAS